ncbi:hypothetical protein ABTB86_19830, partial [Acinetobacter baumannii]
QLVETSRAAISDVLQGRDDRLIVVVGPCSIHDHDQAMDYARQLKAQADGVELLTPEARDALQAQADSLVTEQATLQADYL